MDDNSKNVRRTGQIGEGEDDVVSIQDILDEEKRLQTDASAVLGASDPVNCTYPKGYLKRQALYACATCTPNGNAGICLACSYACHEGHDLYELYTKRYFCCDCGNDKFPQNECKLVKNKKLNSRNRYNHNYKGLYCSCSRPYPDDDDSIGDEMIQCIMCEDWLHGRHLNTSAPDGEEFMEMICTECMSKFPFLWAYYVSSKCDIVKKETPNTSGIIDVEQTSTENKTNQIQQTDTLQKCEQDVSDKENQVSEDKGLVVKEGECGKTFQPVTNTSPSGCKRTREENVEDEEAIKSKIQKIDSEKQQTVGEDCILQSLKEREFETFEYATFWAGGWRSKLCKCQECMEMYKDRDIEFILDESDTVQAYEESGTNTEEPDIEQEEEENLFAGIQGMHRVQQIEIARGVRHLQTELAEFLQGFHREGKVVTEEAVREFFQSLEEKRKRMNLPQNNCR